jgi:hypothetical protein
MPQHVRMYRELHLLDRKFVARLERAFANGRENRASASACERPGAGDRDRLFNSELIMGTLPRRV